MKNDASPTKRCPHCDQVKPTTEFGLNRAKPDGLSVYCFRCKREKNVAVNAKRRDQIRQWERDHAPRCVDCGEPTSFNGKRKQERCWECYKNHQRDQAVARTRKMLTLRQQGLLNYEIAERMGGTSAQSVARALSRPTLRHFGLLAERVGSPYHTRNA